MMMKKFPLDAKTAYAVANPNTIEVRLFLYTSAGRVADIADLRITRATVEHWLGLMDDEYEKAAQPQLPWSE